MRNLAYLFIFIFFFALTQSVQAETLIYNLPAFDNKFKGDVSFSVADLGRDNLSEVIIGSGPIEEPLVKIFRQDGSLINQFLVYKKGVNAGVKVAVGDLDGDGLNEIITGPGPGELPRVKVFEPAGKTKLAGEEGFLAYSHDFRGGVNVAVGDVDGDGKKEIITAPGPTGGPEVKVFDSKGDLKAQGFVFDRTMTKGVSLAVGNLDAAPGEEIVVGVHGPAAPWVKIFKVVDKAFQQQKEFLASDANDRSGVSLSVGDINVDGKAEIVTFPTFGNQSQARVWNGSGALIDGLSPALVNGVSGGLVKVAVSNLNSDTSKKIIFLSSSSIYDTRPGLERFIDVNLSQQRLYAYEYGHLIRTFLVSSGIKRFPTPVGEFTILAKVPKVKYQWTYGPNNPNNYDLGTVPYNLRFKNRYYIHYAPWHNNFGRPMSHGCVNVDKVNAKWIYQWADKDGLVNIHI